jgi:hypothetical protein
MMILLDILSNDLVEYISTFVPNNTLVDMFLTNTIMYQLLNSEQVWEQRVKCHYPRYKEKQLEIDSVSPWRDLYIDCSHEICFCPVYKSARVQLENNNRTAISNNGPCFAYVRLDKPVPKENVTVRVSIRPEELPDTPYYVGGTLIGLASSFVCDKDGFVSPDDWNPGRYVGEMNSTSDEVAMQNYGYADNGYLCSQGYSSWEKVFVFGTSFGIEVNLMAPCEDKNNETHTKNMNQSGLGYLRFYNDGEYVGPVFYNIYQPDLEQQDKPYELYIVCNLYSNCKFHVYREDQVPKEHLTSIV